MSSIAKRRVGPDSSIWKGGQERGICIFDNL